MIRLRLKSNANIGGKEEQARIQHLKEVSQTEEIVLFPFISNSDIFYSSQVSLSMIRGQDPRYATDFLLLIHQGKYTGWVPK